jgi:hypothetical protein
MKTAICILLLGTLSASAQSPQYEIRAGQAYLTRAGADHFAELPLRCMQREFPYKTGISFTDSTLAVKPEALSPGVLWLLRLALQRPRPLDAGPAPQTLPRHAPRRRDKTET